MVIADINEKLSIVDMTMANRETKNKPLAKENFYKTLEAFSDCV